MDRRVCVILFLFGGLCAVLGCIIPDDPAPIGRRTVRAAGAALKVMGDVTPNNRSLCPETPENRPPNRIDTAQWVADLRRVMNFTNTTGDSQRVHAYIIPYEDEHQSRGADYDLRLQFISGYSGSSGYAVVTQNKQALWVDGRYFLQADQQMDCNWIMMEQGMAGFPTITEWLLAELSTSDRVGADPKLLTTSLWQSYESALAGKNISMVEMTQELIDLVWLQDRTPRPNEQIIIHDMEFAGREWTDKVEEVRTHLTNEDADVLMISALDEIVWLFNLRGYDRPTSPLFYSYCMVFKDKIRLYLVNYQEMISNNNITDHLNTNANGSCDDQQGVCVSIGEYSDALTDLKNLQNEATVNSIWITPTSSYAIYSNAGDKRHVDASPIQLMKSVKNPTEIRKYKECQIRDSAALVEFITKLEREVKAGETWTELTASAELTETRGRYEHYQMNSFTPISAVGENAAVIHYRPTPETDTPITTQEVYLLDSGGNYFDGTTDVTRTFHFGTPRAIEIEAYTRVLIGVIELAETVWPFGWRGTDIDARTRTILWQNGWDYNHGTGHGIGYYINVHEGPGTIRMGWRPEHSALYEGMFFSDEPGYYEPNDYGIRLETIVGIVKADVPNRFNDVDYLTFEPVTLVPFEPHLINYEMLNERHRKWLNRYNEHCVEETGQYLLDRGQQDAYDWIVARTQPIPDKPHWDQPPDVEDSAPLMGAGLVLSIIVPLLNKLLF